MVLLSKHYNMLQFLIRSHHTLKERLSETCLLTRQLAKRSRLVVPQRSGSNTTHPGPRLASLRSS